MSAYLNNLYLVDRIYLRNENEIKVQTILHGMTHTNLYAKMRMTFFEKNLRTEYVINISECGYDEKNDMQSNLGRL